jgi:hypothetical protein
MPEKQRLFLAMRTVLQHFPELFALGVIFLPAIFVGVLGYLVGRERGSKGGAQRFAKREDELQRECAVLRARIAQLDGSETLTFTGSIGDPAALAAAFNIMEKRRKPPQP